MLAGEDAHVSSQGVGPFRTENPAYLFVSKTQRSVHKQHACIQRCALMCRQQRQPREGGRVCRE